MRLILILFCVLTLSACFPDNDEKQENTEAVEDVMPAPAPEQISEDIEAEEKSSQTETPAIKEDGFPAALMINGKPFDPICLDAQNSMEEELKTIDLTACDTEAYKNIEHFQTKPYERAASYEYDDIGLSKPFISYQYVGAVDAPVDAPFPLIIRWSGGGTGQFSALYKMKRSGNTLEVLKGYAGGDRCNNGIDNAFVDGEGQLNYEVNITPYDILKLGAKKDDNFLQSVKPYDDIDDCAGCCYGLARYSEDEFAGMTLGDNLERFLIQEDTSEGETLEKSKQDCFDEIISLQLQANQSHFAPEELKTLTREIEHTCLGRIEGE